MKKFHLKLHCCDVCEFETVSETEIKTHIECYHRDLVYKCNQCESEFSTTELLQSHIIGDHKDSMMSCDNCSYVSTIKTDFEKHKSSQHMGVIYQCDMCPYVAETFNDSQTHIDTHHQVTNISCDKGELISKSNGEINISSEIYHSRNKAFKCNKCDMCFKDVETLNNHKQNMHKSFKPGRNYNNGSCSYGIYCLFSHNQIQEGQFVCYVCGDTFTEKVKLMTHRKNVYNNLGVCKKFQTNSCTFSAESCWWEHNPSTSIPVKTHNQVFQWPSDNMAPPLKMDQKRVMEALERLTTQMAQFKKILEVAGLLM